MPETSPIELLDVERRSPRLSELRLRSAALGRETRVWVLTPGDDGAGGGDPLPVLFLLHGGGADSDQSNWTDRGSAEGLTDGLPLVVVMPDGGKGGWYSDWLRPHSSEGRQWWERYHVGELLNIFGDHVTDEVVWRAANPVDLAANLATVALELRTGNGKRGGPYGDGPEGDTQEAGVSQATATLHRRLDELGIPHVYDDDGAGAHTWPYWVRRWRRRCPACSPPRPSRGRCR